MEDDTTVEDSTTTTNASGVAATTKVQAATTVPSTTRAAATRPATTTTKPQTTAPSTTAPSTTKAATTTDPYGINDVTVVKPSSYLAESYTAYVTQEGVILRSGPATSYERVLYLSKGADIKVLSSKNGFYYVRSNRYGVYGWVSGSYVANSRPVEKTTIASSGTVSPDKKYATAEIKTTTDGLNLRKGPSTDYDIITLIPKNYPVKVIGYKQGVSGWVYVVDTTYGYAGWVSSAYIK